MIRSLGEGAIGMFSGTVTAGIGVGVGDGLDETSVASVVFLRRQLMIRSNSPSGDGHSSTEDHPLNRRGTHENLAPCFVTAATTPPLSLPFFRSFLEAKQSLVLEYHSGHSD